MSASSVVCVPRPGGRIVTVSIDADRYRPQFDIPADQRNEADLRSARDSRAADRESGGTMTTAVSGGNRDADELILRGIASAVRVDGKLTETQQRVLAAIGTHVLDFDTP